ITPRSRGDTTSPRDRAALDRCAFLPAVRVERGRRPARCAAGDPRHVAEPGQADRAVDERGGAAQGQGGRVEAATI
ncbi:hypothetical protein Tdes44962_MAKER10047, partial [Teratosphaeria destructans]